MLKEVKQLNTQKNQMGMFTWNEQGGKISGVVQRSTLINITRYCVYI